MCDLDQSLKRHLSELFLSNPVEFEALASRSVKTLEDIANGKKFEIVVYDYLPDGQGGLNRVKKELMINAPLEVRADILLELLRLSHQLE